MSKSDVRVRFAPSPTGPLHIGGVRTALFNYLFARKLNGTFILRIEDTDQTRFVPGAEEYILESLAWLGIEIDESDAKGGSCAPYKQSQRKDIYIKYAQQLIDSGWAYYAFDKPEDLDVVRAKYEQEGKTFAYDQHVRAGLDNSLNPNCGDPLVRVANGEHYVIRFKIPENIEIVANDMVRGRIVFNSSTLDDKVIFKSDGLPTYHLANVVDDRLMNISHVIRGEEWLPSVPLHILLYRAFGWESEMPQFAHLPLILKPSGKGKLSKRDGDKDGFPVFPLSWKGDDGEISKGYKEYGYFPEAVVNLLALLGWNPGTEQEMFTMEQLIEAFSFDHVHLAGARFNPEKAKWFNHQYLQKQDLQLLANGFEEELAQKGITGKRDLIMRLLPMVKERVTFVNELWGQTFFFFESPVSYDEKVAQKRWKDGVPALMASLPQVLESVKVWEAAAIKEEVSKAVEASGVNFGAVMNSFRLAIVGGSFGPDLFDIIEIIGKEESCARLKKAVSILGL